MTPRPVGFRALVILLHALAGWAWCGALIGVARQVLSMNAALIIHAIGAPLGFAAISFFYFRRFAFTTPLRTAAAFLGVVAGLDLFLVAPFLERSYAMFASPLGTWIPFALIFVATYVTGRIAAHRPRPTPKLPAQPVGPAPIFPV
jgi:hypothetical protein